MAAHSLRCLPPGWFALEYFFLFKKYALPGSFDNFKYGQEVASQFWLAVSAVLTALFVGPDVLQKLTAAISPELFRIH